MKRTNSDDAEEKNEREFEETSDFGQEINVNDIGHYVKHSENLNSQVRLHLCQMCIFQSP